MLKLYLYGYLNQVASSRRLEREAQRTVTSSGRLTCSGAAVEAEFKNVAANVAEFLGQFRADPRFGTKSPVGGCMVVAVQSDGTKVRITGAKVR